MNKPAVANLVYIKKTTDEKRNPVDIRTEKTIRAKEINPFSQFYYENGNRSQQLSKNIRIPAHLVNSELMECKYEGVRYKVRNILMDRKNKRFRILDIEEMK